MQYPITTPPSITGISVDSSGNWQVFRGGKKALSIDASQNLNLASGIVYAGIETGAASYTMVGKANAQFTGSTAAQTVTLPASPNIGQESVFTNLASVSVTLAANSGQAIYQTTWAAGVGTVNTGSLTVPANGSVRVRYTAANVWSC